MASNFEFYSPTRVIFGKGTEQRVGAPVSYTHLTLPTNSRV